MSNCTSFSSFVIILTILYVISIFPGIYLAGTSYFANSPITCNPKIKSTLLFECPLIGSIIVGPVSFVLFVVYIILKKKDRQNSDVEVELDNVKTNDSQNVNTTPVVSYSPIINSNQPSFTTSYDYIPPNSYIVPNPYVIQSQPTSTNLYPVYISSHNSNHQ